MHKPFEIFIADILVKLRECNIKDKINKDLMFKLYNSVVITEKVIKNYQDHFRIQFVSSSLSLS